MTEYPRFHRDRTNLVLHVVAVPAFVLGFVGLVVNLATMSWAAAGVSALGAAVAYAVQGIGHQREGNPPIPFAGPGDFVYRLFAEQFYRFPRFVLTGGFARAWRGEPS